MLVVNVLGVAFAFKANECIIPSDHFVILQSLVPTDINELLLPAMGAFVCDEMRALPAPLRLQVRLLNIAY